MKAPAPVCIADITLEIMEDDSVSDSGFAILGSQTVEVTDYLTNFDGLTDECNPMIDYAIMRRGQAGYEQGVNPDINQKSSC